MTKRDQHEAYEQWMQVSHNQTEEGYTLETPMDVIFDSNATCALVPETIIGPYWVSGEMIRSNITDSEPGVPLHLDIQFVDIDSCEPVPRMVVDLWHANATGVYSGVSAQGQGGLDTTFGRGVQRTDADGVTKFDTVFPGHYYGRTNHIHVMSSENATVLDNGTYTDGRANHIGQLYFGQSIIDAVTKLAPYSGNRAAPTPNDEDTLAFQQATARNDPFMDYVMLGPDPADGLLMWITVGVDRSANYTREAQAAAHYCSDGVGGVEPGEACAAPPPAESSSSSSASAEPTTVPTSSPSPTTDETPEATTTPPESRSNMLSVSSVALILAFAVAMRWT
jgi:protocatechuate 3,4-dioxygenase beta subunit